MSAIYLETFILAPKAICFDLSRSIDLHQKSMTHSKETAIAGITSGLIERGQTVTWKARHFGLWWKMSVEIVDMKSPDHFIDKMTRGPFKCMRHTHRFFEKDNGTVMQDEFVFASPVNILGKLADWVVIKRYMKRLLQKRNAMIKLEAEYQNGYDQNETNTG